MAPADPVDSTPSPDVSTTNQIFGEPPIAIFRTTRSFIVPLRLLAGWERSQVSAARTRGMAAVPYLPCRISKQFPDPDTGQPRSIVISIEPGFDEDQSVRIMLDTDADGVLRAALSHADSESVIASIPFHQRTDLARQIPFGFYRIEIAGEAKPLIDFRFIIEPFSLPEALEAAQEYLSRREYMRATAILDYAAERYPESADAQDLLCTVHGLIASDPTSYEREQAEFVAFRGITDLAGKATQAFQTARQKFGLRLATLIAGEAFAPHYVTAADLERSREATVSTVVLRSLLLLAEKLEADADPRNEPLRRMLRIIAERAKRLDEIIKEVSSRIADVRSTPEKDDDEKFALVKDLLEEFADELAKIQISVPDYAPFFRERIGEACWNWLGGGVQRVFNTAEDLYHYQAGKPQDKPSDFTAGVLEMCRGVEELLNKKLDGHCRSIQDATNRNPDCTDAALTEFPEKTLMDLLKPERSMSMWKVATLLRLGRVIQAAKPDIFAPKLRTLVTRTPGPADIEHSVYLCYIASELRNGKVHTTDYTAMKDMQLLRKLALGLDPEGVGNSDVRKWIENSWLFRKKAQHICGKISEGWPKFPGIIPLLWEALEMPTATSTAA